MPVNKPFRYAHSDGHTDLCYSEDGKYIITCGNDGDIRMWLDLEDDDPSSQCVAEKAIAVTQKGKQLFVGTDNNAVQVYTFPEIERDGIISRFTAPVTHITVSKDGTVVAAGSCDMEIHVKNVTTQELTVLTGHKGPIFGVFLDPKLQYLVSSSGDGTVQVWDLVQKKSAHTWTAVPICNSFFLAKILGRVSWHPIDGRYIAIPYGAEISIWERDTWNKVHAFTDNASDKGFSIATFSPCGRYLAGCTTAGSVYAWDVKTKTLVGNECVGNFEICALTWNPTGNGEIAFCTTSGQLGAIEDFIPKTPTTDSKSVIPVRAKNVDEGSNGVTENEFDRPLFEDDDDDENAISLEKIKAELALPLDGSTKSDSVAGDDDDVRSKVGVSVSDLQMPFQPSATPSHLQHRYMVWNSVGIVQCTNTPDDNVIDVEFHDISVHHALHIKNYLNHHIASLTEEALVLACEKNDDTPSKLVCVLLNCWDGTREWTTDLPDDEEAVCLASGKSWIALGTDARVLRLWTTCGTQREMVALPGPVLCLAGHADKLMVVCHLGPGIEGDQNLGFCIMSLSKGRCSSWQPLPLTPRSTLQWAGFSDEGTPCVMDSEGSLRMLTPRGYWLPACNTQSHVRGKSDHYFVLGISEQYQNIRAVMCKGSHYPVTVPRPTVVELPLQITLCELSTEKGKLEEKFWRSCLACPSLTDTAEIDLAVKETVIKLFALACRGDVQARAAELVSLMPNPQVVQLALKYASKLGRNQLADRILNSNFTTQEDNKPRFVWEVSDMEGAHNEDNTDSGYLSYQYRSDSFTDSDRSQATYDRYESQSGTQFEDESQSILPKRTYLNGDVPGKQITLISDTPPTCEKKRNPFKKSLPKIEPGRGLSNLANAVASRAKVIPKPVEVLTKKQKERMKKQAAESKKQAAENKKQNDITRLVENQKKVEESSETNNDVEVPTENHQEVTKASAPQTFVQWYAEKKASLQEEFPDLNPAELTKLAMKRYKEMRAKFTEQEVSQVTELTNGEQHENGNCADNSGNGELEEKDNAVLQQKEIGMPEKENRKRKTPDEEENKAVKKVATGSSKLSAFLFKKT